MELLQEYEGQITAQLPLSEEVPVRVEQADNLSPLNALRCTTFLGVVKVVVALIGIGCCHPTREDFGGALRLHGMPGGDMRRRRKYYSRWKMSAPISQILGAGRPLVCREGAC